MLEKFLATIRGRLSRPIQYYEDICVRCGACVDACHFYAYSKEPAHIPSYRVMLVKKLLRAKQTGGLRDWYHEAGGGERMSSEIQKAMWECTGCRRCAVFCPFDLDTALLIGAGRYSLLQEGLGPEIIAEIGSAEVSKGEIIDAIKEFYVEQTNDLEARLREEFAPDLEIPIDKEGAEYLYVPLVGEHAVRPVAQIFHAAKGDWTLSLFTATNHSFFVGDMAKAKGAAYWIVKEARRLGVKTLVYPECGHATRIMLQFFESWFGSEIADLELVGVDQLVASFLREGKIRVQPGSFDVPLTYHDPCNLGRNSGIYEGPRSLIRAVATDFRELTPNRQFNWCCGGGGGLIAAADEMKDVRMKAGRKKAEQIQETNAQWVVTTCENCKAQLEDLNSYYGLGVEVKGVVDLVADALIL